MIDAFYKKKKKSSTTEKRKRERHKTQRLENAVIIK